ncbi:hypothetical protein CYY_004975 [Polysphondylium violaceum]|uniref:Transmembrane protein n=1 Tax=Polysphondylium violaceum TaxID=133409 RepID=A0A8J4PUI3_9MYCE|nr:hypothetical protein CYY_004975 [Polysphondylium violaceum]
MSLLKSLSRSGVLASKTFGQILNSQRFLSSKSINTATTTTTTTTSLSTFINNNKSLFKSNHLSPLFNNNKNNSILKLSNDVEKRYYCSSRRHNLPPPLPNNSGDKRISVGSKSEAFIIYLTALLFLTAIGALFYEVYLKFERLKMLMELEDQFNNLEDKEVDRLLALRDYQKEHDRIVDEIKEEMYGRKEILEREREDKVHK